MTVKQKDRNILPNELADARNRQIQHLPELHKAWSRLDTWPDHNGQKDLSKPREAAMRWAIAFAEKDLNALSEGDFRNLQYELAGFVLYEPIYIITPYIPPKGVIEKVQHWLRESLHTLVDKSRDHCIGYSVSKHIRILWRSRDTAEGSAKWVDSRSYEEFDEPHSQAQLEEELISHFFYLLKDYAENLCRCPCEDCRKIFLKNRANATCCSKVCTSRHAKRRELGIRPERFGKRGRPPSTVTTKRKTDGQKKTQQKTPATRQPARRVSAKKP